MARLNNTHTHTHTHTVHTTHTQYTHPHTQYTPTHTKQSYYIHEWSWEVFSVQSLRRCSPRKYQTWTVSWLMSIYPVQIDLCVCVGVCVCVCVGVCVCVWVVCTERQCYFCYYYNTSVGGCVKSHEPPTHLNRNSWTLEGSCPTFLIHYARSTKQHFPSLHITLLLGINTQLDRISLIIPSYRYTISIYTHTQSFSRQCQKQQTVYKNSVWSSS